MGCWKEEFGVIIEEPPAAEPLVIFRLGNLL
jgi:hypothetical protein